MDLKLDSVLVGALAGVASTFLLLGAAQPSFLSIVLFSAAALPIFIAGLGWSNQASITSVLVAFVLMFIFTGPEAALTSSITSLLPSAWIAHLSTLARPANDVGGPDDKLVWYPLSQIMLHTATMMILATMVIGWMIGYGPEISDQLVDSFIALLSQSGEGNLSIQNVDATKRMFAMLIPMTQSAMWVIIIFAAWYFAGHIVRMSGRTKRPRDNMHLMLRMPSVAILLFGVGVILTFFSGTVSYIGAAMTGGFGAGFLLSGLAFLHFKAFGKMWRGPVLWATYALILLFSFPALILIVFGMIEANKPTPMLVSDTEPNIEPNIEPNLDE